ncbi:MAG TPA: SurA N-terminal domain-containing protein [Pseudolabrys sp.]
MRAGEAAAGSPDAMDIAMQQIKVKLKPLRRWLAGIACAAAIIAPSAASAQVVVVANGSPITAFDIEQRSKLDAAATHKKIDRQEIIQELIDERLKIARAKLYSLDVSDAEVNNAFANMAKAQHITPDQFSQVLARAGVEPSTLKARIRAEITWGQLIRGKFASTLEIGDSDITKALQSRNENANDAVGYLYTLYPVIVVVPSGSSQAEMENKKREADSLRGRFVTCKDGLAFARALRDVAVREPINKNSSDLAPALRELLGTIEVGHLTAPEVTPQGLEMFALCNKKETKTDSPMKVQLRQELYAKKFDNEAKKFLDEIRKQAMIEYKEKK